MCGIIAVVSRPSGREAPDAVGLLGALDRAEQLFETNPEAALDVLRSVDADLRGVAGVAAGGVAPELTGNISSRIPALEAAVDRLEVTLGPDVGPDDPGTVLITALRDVLWALRHDRVRTIEAVTTLAGRGAGMAALAGYLSVQQALSALDRLEVRGRSALSGDEILIPKPSATAKHGGRDDQHRKRI